ncbi:hypothetical protein CC78DRAFT_533481 [Lojkania enalia]|uniref:Uncharacterized protein n=1 Tax=Lojkania enalia TaxID=147567 RepID=A0A9P4K8G6_9PLEO|nr:hypothetical protein CC78DRAFT_533481 [Didymosphaeria enalia]
MGWWRRDPLQWCRSSLLRYGRLSLRDDGPLRSRCFSKSQQNPAQHNDNDNEGRPAGLTDVEWIQLRHYRRWKQRLQEDPYRALFGASNDMLRGKGLREYEWVYRAFPKWMREEIDLHKWHSKVKPGKCDPSDPPVSDGADYSKKANISAASDPNARQSTFKASNFESTEYWRGVASPSDSRRPLENVTGLDVTSDTSKPRSKDTSVGRVAAKTEAEAPQEFVPKEGSYSAHVSSSERTSKPDNAQPSEQEASSRETTFIKEFLAGSPKSVLSDESKSKDWRQTVLDRRVSPTFAPELRGSELPSNKASIEPKVRSSLLASETEPLPTDSLPSERFWPAMSNRGQSLADQLSPIPSSQSCGDGKSINQNQVLNSDVAFPEDSSKAIKVGFIDPNTREWRYNLLDANEDATASPATEQSRAGDTIEVGHKDPISGEWTRGPIISKDAANHVRQAPPQTSDRSYVAGQKASNEVEEPAVKYQNMPDVPAKSQEKSASPSSTSHRLIQLPEHDLDFITAEQIRASMGARKSAKESDEEKILSGERLENDFENVYSEEPGIDPMIETKIVNEQGMRRMERDLKEENIKAEAKINEPLDPPHPLASESTLARLTRWLRTSSDTFTQHFWQQPLPEDELWRKAKATAMSSDGLLKGVITGVQKSHNSMKQVKEDLGRELPCSYLLASLLTRYEERIVPTDGLKYDHHPALLLDHVERFSSSDPVKRVNLLRKDLYEIEVEYERACKSLDQMQKAPAILYPSYKGLKTASAVLEKNTKLSRRLLFSVQAGLESQNSRAVLLKPAYLDLAHRLLSMRDAQLALQNLVERALQVFDLNGEIKGQAKVLGMDADATVKDDVKTKLTVAALRFAAAEKRLNEEIEAQKDAMRGLSDDGYAREPIPTRKISLDLPSPLANSLFRPFGKQLDSLGKEESSTAAEKDSFAGIKQDAADKELVTEIRKIYEDTYGPITVNHRQILEEKRETTAEETEPTRISKQESKNDIPVEQLGSRPAVASSVIPDNISILPKSLEAPAATTEANKLSSDVASPPQECASARKADAPINPGEQEQKSSAEFSDSTLESPHPSMPPTPIISKVLAYDPATDEVSVMTTQSYTPSPSSSYVPLHEALQSLDSPSKFLPHLPLGFDIIAAQRNLLIIRESEEPSTEIRDMRIASENETRDEEWKRINPVDGTMRFSPTGYVGVDDLREEVGREMEAIRRRRAEEKRKESRDNSTGKKRGGAIAGVLKTGILAAVGCYVIGVVGELFSK